MKQCNTCEGIFDDSFEFCPLDARALSRTAELTALHTREFNVTLVNSDGLPVRLKTEIAFVLHQFSRTWPELRQDPTGVSRRVLTWWACGLKRATLAPHAAAATLTAISLVLSVILTIILLGQPEKKPVSDIETEETAHLVMIELSAETDHEGAGVGTGSKGRVGFASGKGEGSDSESQASRGGGGGGEHDFRPAQHGGVPQPSEIPAPITPPLAHTMLPIAGVDLDPALWARPPLTTYGDPRSKSEPPSNGPGEGGGIGSGSGEGVGDGRGNGIGP